MDIIFKQVHIFILHICFIICGCFCIKIIVFFNFTKLYLFFKSHYIRYINCSHFISLFSEPGLQALYDSGVLKLVIKMLNMTTDEISKVIFENLLKELATNGILSFLMLYFL